MKSKAILFTKLNTAELVDVQLEAPKRGEVMVKLHRSTISSGTERANLIGVDDNATGIYSNSPDGQVTWPRLGGYSSAGIVEAVGEGVTSVKPGDRVALSWSVHQHYICVKEHLVYRLPDSVSFEHAALTHISTFPMAAIRKCRLEIGEAALVMGQGVLGQVAVMLLKAAGAVPIIAADPNAEKRRRALALGADYAFDPTAEDFARQVKAVSGYGHKVQEGRVDGTGANVVIEVTGIGQALDMALDAIAPFGRLALLGCTRNSNFTINYYRKVHGRGITMVGAHTNARPDGESAAGWWTTRDDALAFIRLMEMSRISLAGFVDEVHSPAQCGEVYRRLAEDKVFPTVQFDWERL
jgi:2-desacetyl-2-hydroxyethyl bacteriochlorophyllide A dehydrogenase